MTKVKRNPRIGRTKIGLILPSVNCITEPEYYRVAPTGMSFHSARVFLMETTPAGLMKMEEDLESACRLIATVSPHAVAYCCTSGSLIRGLGYDRVLIDRIQPLVGCPAITMATAMVEGLRAMGIRRVTVATPYLDVVNEREEDFLNKSGFEVVACKGLQKSGPAVREQTPEQVYELVKSIDTAQSDGVFISCADFRAMEVIETLEKELGKPVVTGNQSTLWALLKMISYPGNVKGYGRLLAEMPPLNVAFEVPPATREEPVQPACG
jgi:maleate isomerase